MQGWIKLHRKLLKNPIFSSEKGLKIWIWCLLKATHKKQEVYIGLKKVIVNEGQFIYGRKKASKELKIKESTVRNYMELLNRDSYVDIKKTTKYSLITIRNWKKYQDDGQQVGQQSNNRVTTKQQQSNTYKNDKNVKNDKNQYCGSKDFKGFLHDGTPVMKKYGRWCLTTDDSINLNQNYYPEISRDEILKVKP